MADMLDTGTVSLFLISKKFRTVLMKAGLTGWQTFEIKIQTKKGIDVPGYYGLCVTGRCGPVDYSRGEVFEKPPPVPNGLASKYRKDFYIGLDEWDGSDFSRPEGNLTIILTQKAADVIRKHKLTNTVLTNLEEEEISFMVADMVLSRNSDGVPGISSASWKQTILTFVRKLFK